MFSNYRDFLKKKTRNFRIIGIFFEKTRNFRIIGIFWKNHLPEDRRWGGAGPKSWFLRNSPKACVPRDTLILSRDNVFERNERFRSVAFQNTQNFWKLIIFEKVMAVQSWWQNRKSRGNRGIHNPFTKESSWKLSQMW